MNLSNIHSYRVHLQNSVRSLLLRCGPPCIHHRCQVHPEFCNPEDLEFVELSSQRIIRVLHISHKPINQYLKPFIAINHKEDDTNFDISSEEYWFTRSNRPFRIRDACDCISNMYNHSHEFAESSRKYDDKYTTDGCNEMTINPLDDCYSKIFTNERGKILIETFADSFAKVLLNEVFFHVLNKLKYMPIQDNFPLKNTVLNVVPVFETISYNHLKLTYNSQSYNCVPDREGKTPNIHRSPNEGSTAARLKEEPSCNRENEMFGASHVTCNGGYVNQSFSGSLNEPDALPSVDYDCSKIFDHLSVNSGLLQCAVKEAFEDTDSGVNSSSLESRQNANVEENSPFNLKVIETLKEYDFDASTNEVGSANKANDTFLKEENSVSLNEVVTQNEHGECSVEIENLPDRRSSCLTNPRDEKTNIRTRVNEDCCRHTKNTQKPLLLFLHGAGSSADVWSVLLEYFASAGYEVLAPDMLGHGYSSAPDNRAAYTFDRLLQDTLQIFDRFVSDHQKCVVIGHSYGSCFAAALARYRPQQVVQLVLLSSGGPSPLVPKQAFFSLPSCMMSFMKPFLMCGFKRDLFYAPRGKHLPSSCTYELPPYVLKHVECGQEWSDGDSAFHRRILVPTLLVHGLKDPHITLVEECEMERTIPRSFLEVISNAGHMPMLDTPEQLCHMIHCFITWWNS